MGLLLQDERPREAHRLKGALGGPKDRKPRAAGYTAGGGVLNQGLKFIDEINIRHKRVLIRVDFNVPMDENNNITEDTRIRSVLPTINYALDESAKVVLASHLGRPKGKRVPEMSLAPVAKRLGRLLEKDVAMTPDCVGEDVEKIVANMKAGDVLLLENLRFHPEEEKNDDV